MSSIDNSTVSSIEIEPLDWEFLPCVQYGFSGDEGPARAPKLRTIFEPVPENATTASPVYLLPPDEYRAQLEMENPYKVSGYSMKATEIQDRCEQEGRVRYPVHVESDKLYVESASTLIEWFREFVEEWLNASFAACTLYFSGNRSIHVHIPRFILDEQNRRALKQLAEEFCEQTGAELDCGIYSRKRMFRLPGVKHRSTGLPKVECSTGWEAEQIVKQVQETTPSVPDSYASVLQSVFLTDSLTQGTDQPEQSAEQDLFRILHSDKTALELVTTKNIEEPLIEQEQCPEDTRRIPRWASYNAKEFSPYAFASEGERSVAALRVMDTPFARRNKRDGASMVPAWFYGAVGCDGNYTKQQEHAPLQLSKQDYDKWNFEPGDTLVIIGGQSRNSRFLDTTTIDTRVVGNALTDDGGDRNAALEYLAEKGYDIGSAGSSGSTASRRRSSSKEAARIFPAREQPQTEAEHLQRQAEQEGIETLSHDERIQVACRHLQYGWQPAWDWFREEFGSDFKPQVTYDYFRGIISDYADDYSHVEVPPGP